MPAVAIACDMKIAHVTSEICRRSAGLGAAVASISRASEHRADEVCVFGLSSPDWLKADRQSWTGAPAVVFEASAWSGPLRHASGMLRALRAFEPDVVHLHGLWTYPSIAALSWARTTGRPLVVSAHGMLFATSLRYNPLRKALARRLFQDQVLRAAALLHATSEDEERAYRALGFRNPIGLIPLGVELVARPEVDDRRHARRALFLGRLHHQKGIDWLIEAWARVEADFPDWELTVAGPVDQSFAQRLLQLKRTAEGRRVRFLGAIYGQAKYLCIAESELFVMPSRSENFGLTAAESLMMEVPVIASKGTPWSGLVDRNAGWWCDPGAAGVERALREAMQLTRCELREKGRKGRAWIEAEFCTHAITSKWRAIYESLRPDADHQARRES